MAMYATPSELASFLQKDLDTSTATLALTTASGLFARAAATRFESNTTTWKIKLVQGLARIAPPDSPVTAVSAVRVEGVTLAVTDYTLIRNVLYRDDGFGPGLVEIDYTYGYATVPDDVKGAVLEMAGQIYEHPDLALTSETIDDYSYRSADGNGGVQLSSSAKQLAGSYRGLSI